MPLDTSVYDKLKTFADYQRADQDFQLKKALTQQQLQTGGIDAQSKANIYATQVLSAATATGDQGAYDKARSTLANNGIDVSTWSPDVQSASQQAQAARLAQSPLGSLLNAGLKAESNTIAGTQAMGNIKSGAAISPLSTSLLNGGALGINPMLPKLIQAESGGDNNAVSPAGAQGVAGIMPATAADPGYGVKPLQGWDGANPSTAPIAEQERFANNYLNAMQAKNGGNPQLGAAAYNAGPGRVQQALANLPRETQNYVNKVAPIPSIQSFNPPAQQAGETNQAYQQRVQTAFESYKADPNYLAAAEAAKKSGGLDVENAEAAKKADELTKRLAMNLNAMKQLNNDVPTTGFIPGSWKAAGDQALAANNLSNGNIASAANQWDQINNQQILSEIQQFIASGGANTRTNQTLERIVRAASGINRNDLPKSRAAQIDNAMAEIENKNVSAANIAGGNQDYNTIPVQTSPAATPAGLPKGAALYGTSGGKNVYKLPDGTFLMEQ